MQGVEAAVQRGGAAAQRGRLALELAEDVPRAARQVGELRQQADQGVRADLLQRAEERRARGPGRLGPAQPRGLHGPLVEGHGEGRGARVRGAAGRPGRAQPSVHPPSARGASAHPTQRKVRAAAGRRGAAPVAPAAGRRRGGQEGPTDGRAGGRAGGGARAAAGKGSGGSQPRLPGARPRPPTAGVRGAARRKEVQGAAPGRGARWPRRRVETGVPLKFAGRQERAGGSFPPSRLEREEEAGEVPPTPGAREGRRKKGKGEEKRAGPGNHLRLSRPPRPAPEGRRRPRAPAGLAAAARGARSGGSQLAAPLPSKAHGRLGRALARPRGPARGGVERSAGAAEAEAPGTARRTPLGLLTCAPARGGRESGAPRRARNARGLRGSPGLSQPHLGSRPRLLAAWVDPKENIIKSHSGQGVL